MTEEERRISRREAIGAGVALAGGGVLLAGCGSDSGEGGGAAPDRSTPTTRAASAPDCMLSPESTEGPYYLDDGLIRSDIREDREGTQLRLALTVLDAATCNPLAGATVEVWHADAGGVYSGFGEGSGEAYLRGGQRTDGRGVAEFTTIYPGWYPGRAVHIHTMVHAGGAVVHTGQLFFEDEVTAEAYRADPYAARGEPDVVNSTDGIYQQTRGASTLKTIRLGSNYAARISMGVET